MGSPQNHIYQLDDGGDPSKVYFCRFFAQALDKDIRADGGTIETNNSPHWSASGNVIGFDKWSPLSQPQLVNKVASANTRNSHNAEATSTSATYAKVKTIRLTHGLVGQARFLFDLKTGSAPTTVYGRIYRNGFPTEIS